MSFRLAAGGCDINRARPLTFTFDGCRVDAFEGDTIASALLAADIVIVGRSFKYHRPRGVWGAGVEEPNAYVDIEIDGDRLTNVRATTTVVRAGMTVRSVNASPSAARDRKGALDLIARFLPAAFYYKTFMWPEWRYFQPAIRAMAGLGRLDPAQAPHRCADQVNHHCDVLVVGAGPAGLAAADRAAGEGSSVLLVDDRPLPGGTLRHRPAEIDGMAGTEWARQAVDRLRAHGGIYLARTTAFGVYDHGLVGLYQERGDDGPGTFWRVRSKRTVLAAGAIERPLPFAVNDLPGIMSADAALQYLRRYGVLAGRRIVCATTNDSADEVAAALAAAGAEVVLVDSRPRPAGISGVTVMGQRTVVSARGRKRVNGIVLDDGRWLDADSVVVSGGWTPSVHLYNQAGASLSWNEAQGAFLPQGPTRGVFPAGAAAGALSLAEALEGGANAATVEVLEEPRRQPSRPSPSASAGVNLWPSAGAKERVWIDFQNDVTSKDVELAVRENFVSVEHLKRYTTLGMAPDQGKTSNLNGLALLGRLTGKPIPEVGTTRYRPPFVPIPMSAFRGTRGGMLLDPLRRLPLENVHRSNGAVFGEYGGWLRPVCYGDHADRHRSIRNEALRARDSVALFDGSPLGKIEVIGPQARAFVEFVQFGPMASLAPGRCRYSLMLSEGGVVLDDGIVVRVDEERYVLSCSSAHVSAVHAQLEEWRQDRFDKKSVFIHDATTSLATLTVTGPRASEVVGRLDSGFAELVEGQSHMSVREGAFAGHAVRIARVSFTGDASYELSIRADMAELLWEGLLRAGRDYSIALMGIEALMILRAEKGYLIVGKDTDGTTMPHDVGVRQARSKGRLEFVGRRSLSTEEAMRDDRRQLVGMAVGPGEPALAPGAHGVEADGRGWRSIGFVTSSYDSPVLGRPIALGLIERGASRHGETIRVRHLGRECEATICAPCAFDPEGARVNG
ncbi:2Fe-2S iron-sulfur cluster-binding protein [Mesorhizobium sp. 1B3]|uniref:2Fe-2S iron-sulfur cluster-binding protein n=1 Tax=Mesorhizobium sp. 1B3 TaxID=3243599 RepID=UPI003D98C9B3